MEIHRLQPMKSGYSEELFNKLYKETHNLRKKLAKEIDARRYGVSKDVVLSWFDDKFIFVFNKYFGEVDDNVLKGMLISALQTFKFRVMRKAYTQEGDYYSSIIKLEGEQSLINIIPDEELDDTETIFLKYAVQYMKDHLSKDANLIFELTLNPPEYILNRLSKSTQRITNDLLLQFLGLEITNTNKKYISKLRKQISQQTIIAREYFLENPLAITY